MNPDNNRYGEAQRVWKEIGSLSNYDDYDNHNDDFKKQKV